MQASAALSSSSSVEVEDWVHLMVALFKDEALDGTDAALATAAKNKDREGVVLWNGVRRVLMKPLLRRSKRF